jgi:hypothetical protein
MMTMKESAPNVAKDNELELLRIAAKIEAENPLWFVVFGVWTRQLIAFPRFDVTIGTIATATYPGALIERMREIEVLAGVRTGSEAP